MPTPQITVNALAVADGVAKGKRNQQTLESAFPDSPIYTGLMTYDERRASYQGLALDGDVADSVNDVAGETVIGAPGWYFDNYNRDFSNNVPNVEANTADADGNAFGGGRGAPATPYIPSLTSPGPGNMLAVNQPGMSQDALDALPAAADQNEFGVGLGGLANPKSTSEGIEGQSLLVLSSLMHGESYAGSNGT